METRTTEMASSTWREDLKTFGTNHEKVYLTDASELIAIFSRTCLENVSSRRNPRKFQTVTKGCIPKFHKATK